MKNLQRIENLIENSSFEYPGFLNVKINEYVSLNFGYANGNLGYDLCVKQNPIGGKEFEKENETYEEAFKFVVESVKKHKEKTYKSVKLEMAKVLLKEVSDEWDIDDVEEYELKESFDEYISKLEGITLKN